MSEAEQRLAWKSYKDNEAAMTTIGFGPVELPVARPTIEAWRALETVLASYEYDILKSQTHGYFPRNVAGTDVRSLHAFGLAIDVNASRNPFRETPDRRQVRFSDKASQSERARDVRQNRADTDMTPAMIADVRAIRTAGGVRVFGWGGDWRSVKDAMHFHIDCSPAELGLGIDWASVRGHAAFLDGDGPIWPDPDPDEHDDPDHDHFHDDGADQPGAQHETEDEGMVTLSRVERFRPFLDYIALAEGTANRPGGGYDTSLGYGIFTNGEQPLSSMTLDQIDALQRSMIKHGANTFNSSALGRYQIVGKTLRGLRKKLGLSGAQLYSADLQDRLAVELIDGRGRNVVGLRQEWASLTKKSAAEILDAYDRKGSDIDIIPPYRGSIVDPGVAGIVAELLKRLGGRIDLADPDVGGTLKPGDRGPKVTALQESLRQRNYHVGKIDGIYGTLTTAAVAAFQIDNSVAPLAVGRVDQATWDALDRAPSREFSKSREDATADSLRRDGSVIITNADRTRQVGWLSSIFGALGLGNSYLGTGSAAKPASAAGNVATSTDAASAAEALARAVAAAPSNVVREFFGLTQAQLGTVLQKAHDGTIVAAQKAVATVGTAASPQSQNLLDTILPWIPTVLPNVGGSVAALGVGALSLLFGSRIINRRVEQQKQGMNIGPNSV